MDPLTLFRMIKLPEEVTSIPVLLSMTLLESILELAPTIRIPAPVLLTHRLPRTVQL